MDDSCAVCADTLEWVAYGSCGHREVCSTCVVRLRFILDDRRCCICKNESPTVFVTKALGDYTRAITDFSAFPAGAAEGQVGAYWYHEDTQAYFDDVDHYRMIKAMCRLSCSICDKSTEDQGSEGAKRRSKFRNIEQLKSHLYHRHRMLMCSLCLEGRKVFICEQKLYTRSQLNQHVSTGDSDVDGSESERGGFMGHPMCEFCRNPFYGDNELYMHMSTEHYTCHICQRQHPGQYDYYKNYDDLEIHFRQEHFLCEDEACLVKKFIVFQSEPEMKRHNAMEHGGHMSRSKRNAALQIPTSFRYRQSSEQDRGRGRGRRFRPDPSGNQLSMAIQASLETAFVDSSVRDSSSGAQLGSEHGETSQADAVKGSLESLTINAGTGPPSSLAAPSQSYRSGPILEESSFPPLSDFEPPETSSRYAQAVGQSPSVAGRLREESFPPLPGADTSSNPKEKQGSEVLVKNTMAARLQLRSKGSVAILNSSQSRATENRERGPSSSASSSQTRPTSNHEFPSLNSANIQPATNQGVLSSSSARLLVKPAREHGFVSPISAATTWNSKSSVAILNSSQSRATENRELGQSISASSSQARPTSPSLNSANIQPATNQGVLSSSSARLLVKPARENGFVSPISATTTTRNSTSKNKMRHSTSAPNLVEGASSNHPTPMSTVIGNHVLARSSESAPNVEDVHTANKSLVERIRAGLGMDGDRFAAFKSISAEYRQGIISTGEYLSHVQLFGLSHLVFELARLLPDPQKQKELINCYNASLESNEPRENGEGSAFSSKGDNLPVKGKAKFVDRADSSSAKDALTDNILNTVRKLQANYKPPEDVEVLSKDGYRVTKGKLQLSAGEEHSNSKSTRLADSHGNTESPANISNSNPNVGGGGSSKQRRKTSKFQRVRLGDGSVAAFLDHDRSNLSPERTESEASNSPSEGLPVRGVWRNGGGQRLVSNSQKDPTK